MVTEIQPQDGSSFDEGLAASADDGTQEPDEEVVPASRERRPGMVTSPSPSLGDAGKTKKDWKFWKKDTVTTPKLPKTREQRPSVAKGRRVSAAQTIEDVWSGIGGLAVRSGTNAPVGRCLQWQAPVAGEMLDEAVKGTVFDKILLQRIAKGRGRFDAVGAVFGPPLIVLAIQRNPQNSELLFPLLKASIRNSLPLMVPAIKKVKAREEAAEEAARELFPDLLPGEDPVDAIMEMMFLGWTPAQPVPTAETVSAEEVQTV